MSNPSSLARWQPKEWTGKQASALRVDKRHNPGFHAEIKEIGNYIREERNENGQSELVLMEDLGPGVVVRIWFGNVEGNTNTIIRVYFDGDKKASIVTKCGELRLWQRLYQAPVCRQPGQGCECIPADPLCKILQDNGGEQQGLVLCYPIPVVLSANAHRDFR